MNIPSKRVGYDPYNSSPALWNREPRNEREASKMLAQTVQKRVKLGYKSK